MIEPSTEAEIDHDQPPTHEEVQASQPELGSETPKPKARRKPAKAKKAKAKPKAAAKKPAKRKSTKAKPAKAKKGVKKVKKTSAKKSAKKARKPKSLKGPSQVTQKRGVPHDGSPRKKPGEAGPRTEEHAKFGRKMAKARAALDLSQKALAAKTGFTQPGIANIERGRGGDGTHPRQVNNPKWAKLLKALGL